MKEWQPIESAPRGQPHAADCPRHANPTLPMLRCSCARAHLAMLVRGGGSGKRFGYQDEHGQWRNVFHRPMRYRPTEWMPVPPPPSEAA